MKYFAPFFLAVVTLIAISSCQKHTDEDSHWNIEKVMEEGQWKLTLYLHNGVDETANLAAFVFDYNAGAIAANDNGLGVTGTYSAGPSDSNPTFNISFSDTTVLGDISGEWDVVEKSETKVRLQKSSLVQNTPDELVFKKI